MKSAIWLTCAALVTATTSFAAFSDNFDALRAEIAARSVALSGSVDKIEIKQKKLCDQSLVLIDKPATLLATDIKTASKVAGKMIKAFPSEFLSARNMVEGVIPTSMPDLLLGTYFGLGADVQTEIETLGGLIAGLPAGPGKLKAQKQFDIAANGIAQAESALTFAQASSLLGKSLRAALKGQQIAIKAGGGGGGNTGMSATVVIGGTNYNWSAMGGAEWVQNAMILDLSDSDGTLQVSAALCTDFNGVAGDYALSEGCGGVFDFEGFRLYSILAGTLHIATFNTATTSLSGTFAYEASDGETTIIVTNGMFNLKNLLITNDP